MAVEKVPLPHEVHVALLIAPMTSEYFPATQSEHTLSSSAYLPGEQAPHDDEPTDEYVFTSQAGFVR